MGEAYSRAILWEGKIEMATATLKSNSGDQNVCKKKNISWLFGADRKTRSLESLFGITRQSLMMPNSDPRTNFPIPTSHP